MNRLFFSICLTLLVTTSALPACFSIDPAKEALIDYLVEGVFMPLNHVPGMSLSVVENGVTTFSKGYGKMDVEKNLDAGPDTLFAIASISKTFVGTLAVKMLSEVFPSYGEAALDLPIAKLNPSFNFTFSDRFRAEQISLRDLLSHRTCLFSPDLDIDFGGVTSAQDHIYRTRYLKESDECGMRDGWVYNNPLYAFLGEFIASIYGVTVDQLFKDFMIEIGMKNSSTIDAAGSFEDLPNMSQGYYRKDGQNHKFNMKLLKRNAIGIGAGGILSTSTDMAAFMSFHLNKGKVGDKQVVSEEALSWMYKPSIHFTPFYGGLEGKEKDSDKVSGTYAYGLGMMLAMHDGYAIVSHSGNWPPYSSDMYLFPAKKTGVFLTVNGVAVILDGVNLSFVALSVFDIVNGATQVTIPANSAKFARFPQYDVENVLRNSKRNALDDTKNTRQGVRQRRATKIEFEDVIGYYGNELAGDLTIALDPANNSYLEATISEHSIARLFPVSGSETKFLMEWKTDILQFFYTFPEGYLPDLIFYMEFSDPKTILFLWNDVVSAVYVRNATVDTFPVIPWDPTSCGPSNA